MSSWVVVVLVIMLVLAAGFVRERVRVGAIVRWCRSHEFEYSSPPAAADIVRLNALAERFSPRTVSQWGVVLRKDQAGVETTIAEHAERTPRGGTLWHTLAAVRVPGARFDSVRLVPSPSAIVGAASEAVAAPSRGALAQIGLETADRPTLHAIGQGKWAIEAHTAAALAFWKSDAVASLVDRLNDEGPIAAGDDCIVVRLPGLLTASRLDGALRRAADVLAIVQSRR